MQVFALFAPALQWVFRTIVIKFIVLSFVLVIVMLFLPLIAGYIAQFANVQNINTVIVGIPGGVWWWLEIFAIDYGLPLMISASVAAFVIRRLPVIG